jgi:hypothetical protein
MRRRWVVAGGYVIDRAAPRRRSEHLDGSLPVLVAIAGLGYLIARSRSEVLKSIAAATLPGPLGRRYAAVLVRIHGYALLVVGLVGTALWSSTPVAEDSGWCPPRSSFDGFPWWPKSRVSTK